MESRGQAAIMTARSRVTERIGPAGRAERSAEQVARESRGALAPLRAAQRAPRIVSTFQRGCAEPKSRNLWPARELKPKIGEHVRELYGRPRLEYFFKFARRRPLFGLRRGWPSKNDWTAQLNERLQKPPKT